MVTKMMAVPLETQSSQISSCTSEASPVGVVKRGVVKQIEANLPSLVKPRNCAIDKTNHNGEERIEIIVILATAVGNMEGQ